MHVEIYDSGSNSSLVEVSKLVLKATVCVKNEFKNENLKPPTCLTGKSLTNFMTQCCIEYTSPERDANSQR